MPTLSKIFDIGKHNLDIYGYMDIWTSNSKWRFGLEVDIEFKMGYLYPGLVWTWDLGPGTQGCGDPDPGTWDPGHVLLSNKKTCLLAKKETERPGCRLQYVVLCLNFQLIYMKEN